MQIASASPAARERKKEEETRRAFRLARARARVPRSCEPCECKSCSGRANVGHTRAGSELFIRRLTAAILVIAS